MVLTFDPSIKLLLFWRFLGTLYIKVSSVCGREPERERDGGPVAYYGHKIPCPFKAAPSVTNHLIQISSTVPEWEREKERGNTKEMGGWAQRGGNKDHGRTKAEIQREKQSEGRERKNISFIVYICLQLSDSRRGKIFGGKSGAINISVLTINDRRSTVCLLASC